MPSRQRAPQHARTPTREQGWTLSPLFLAPGFTAAYRTTTPPRPRRGRVPQGGKRRSLGHLVHALPPAEPRTHARVPTADAVLTAAHGAGPGSAAFPAATPLLRPTTCLAVSITLRACFLTHAFAHAFTRHRTGKGLQHRHRADVATPTPATTTPRQPPPSVLPPFESSNPRGSLEVIPFWPVAQAPWSSPPVRSPRAAVSLLGISSST
jgi:hypothetical protein